MTTIEERAAELKDEYSVKLDAFVDDLIPPVLMNAEICGSLLGPADRAEPSACPLCRVVW